MRGAGLLLSLALIIALPARAEAGDRAAAAAHFREGSSLYSAGRWADALAEFEAGYDAYPLRGFLVNIGQCYRKLDRLDQAADAWTRFLATHPGDEKLRAEVEEALSEIESARAKPDPTPVIAAPVFAPAPAPVPVLAPAPVTLDLSAPPPAEKPKSRRWVWAVVGVAAAGVAAVAISIGVVEWQASQPRAGSLGLLDGRR